MSRFGRARFIILAVLLVAVAAPMVAYGRDAGPRRQDRPLTALVSVGTAFNFQGRLSDGGSPANGIYDFVFYLYDSPAGGSQVGPAVTIGDLPVSAGLFTTPLDFGNVFHGAQYYLEIQVRPGASAGSYTVLSPRETISNVPDASFAVEAGTADGIQGYGVSSAVPASGNVLTFNGTNWAPAPPSGGGGGGFTLPYTGTLGSGGPLLTLTNTNTSSTTAAGIAAETDSNGTGVPAILGKISSASPSSTSAGVWGLNEGSGRGVTGQSANGDGGYFMSGTGAAVDIDGPIKVTGSKPAAFVFTVSAASVTAAGCSWCATIDNPYAITNPNSIVIVTPYWGSTTVLNNHPIGVFYVAGKWAVFNEDQAPNSMLVGNKFMVLVIDR